MNENDIKSILTSDTNLREAVRRREQKLPSMPADQNGRVLSQIRSQESGDWSQGAEVKTQKSKIITQRGAIRWLYSALGAVAAGLLLLLVFQHQKNNVEPEMVAKHTVQESPTSASTSDESLTPDPSPVEREIVMPIAQPAKRSHNRVKAARPKPAETKTLVAQAAVQPPESEETPTVSIPAENARTTLPPRGELREASYTIQTPSGPIVCIVQTAASHPLPQAASEPLSVSDLRIRGQRLSSEVQQKLHESIPF